MRILIVRLDHMGDVVLTVPPVTHAVKASHPNMEVHVLTTTVGSRILEDDSSIDRMHIFDPPWSVPFEGGRKPTRTEWAGRMFDFVKVYGSGSKMNYDIVIYLSFSPWERLLTRRWSKRRVGYVGPYRARRNLYANYLLTDKVPFSEKIHVTDNAISAVNSAVKLGFWTGMVHLPISEEKRERGRKILGEAKGHGWLVVHAGTSRSMKAWDYTNYLEAMRRLEEKLSLKPVVVGRAEEIGYARRKSAETEKYNPLLVETDDIRDFMSVASCAALFIGNDGGPLHIAAGLGVPAVGIYGPTDEKIYGPRGEQSAVARETAICGRRHYPWKVPTCCKDNDRECLREIRVETVVRAAVQCYQRSCNRSFGS